jgi:hypothetical protein
MRYGNIISMMPIVIRKLIVILLLALCPVTALAANERGAVGKPAAGQVKPKIPDSRQLEKDLQGLSWNQFRSVVEAIPPIRAEVEKYGSAGWHYVKMRYQTYSWKRNIDQLTDGEKRQLAQLIQTARKKR